MSTKKFLAVFDGLRYSSGAAKYAVQLSGASDAYLVGVFLDDRTYHSYSLTGQGGYAKLLAERKELQKTDERKRQASVRDFEKACDAAGVNHIIHHDHSLAVREILAESVYADLLLADKHETFTQYEQTVPTSFIRDVLAGAECPVMVVPDEFKPLNKIILLYDGAPASVYAIKQFSYLFPNLRQLPVEVITIKSSESDRHLPENRRMKELMDRHFTDVAYTIAQGDPDNEIIEQLKYRQQDEVIVLGAYQRNGISRWFKPSMADLLMSELKAPLFVAHR
ncbi:MAG: universal stress protein [Bacteroidetes bacterium]|nr:universal stress protein [Bacteroidota bacterium]